MATEKQCHANFERCDLGSGPSLGGTWSSSTPQFMSMCPLAAMRRRAKITKRLPHGPLKKRNDPLCGFSPDTYWPEYLPWQEPRFWLDAKADAQNRQRFGKFYWKSQFRSLDKCGCLATRKACECGNFNVNNCAIPCTEAACKVALFAIDIDKSERKVDDPAFQPLECDLNCSGCQSEAENEFLAKRHGFEPDELFETAQRDWVPKNTLIEKAMQCDSLSCESSVRAKGAKQSFRVNQTLLATPSGRVKPISESMSGVVQRRNSSANHSQHRFIPQQKSVFSRQGVPNQFANSTTTRTRGAPDGVRWIGQAICSNVAQQPKTCCSFD